MLLRLKKVVITTLKCIKCGKAAEYVVNGNSFCREHLPSPEPGIITQNEQKPAPFIQPESPPEPKKEDIHAAEPVPLIAESKETDEQKPTLLLQQPSLESKKEDIQAQVAPVPLVPAVAKGTDEAEKIPTKTSWSRYLIRTPVKDHWNYYLIIALLIISIILFALYFISPK